MMYRAIFSTERLYGVPNAWVECDGIRLESNLLTNIFASICCALRDAGKPDGAISFYKDGYADAFCTAQSYSEIIERYYNNRATDRSLTESLYLALRKFEQTPHCSTDLKTRRLNSSLLESGLIDDDGITDAGRQALIRYEEINGRPELPSHTNADSMPRMSEANFRALQTLVDDPSTWSTLHFLTRRTLTDKGYVENGSITSKGREQMDVFEPPVVGSQVIDPGTASAEELRNMAEMIGLVNVGSGLRQKMRYLTRLANQFTLEQIEGMVEKANIRARTGRGKQSEEVRKLMLLASLFKAQRLADVL